MNDNEVQGMILEDLPKEVFDELTNPRFITRKHYSRPTYSSGCTGPLCRKAERDRNRKRYEESQTAKGKKYTPFYDIRVDPEEEKILQEIIDWYLTKRVTERATKSPRIMKVA